MLNGMKRDVPMIIRTVQLKDLLQICEIDEKSYGGCEIEAHKDFLTASNNAVGKVAEEDGKIQGYILYTLHEDHFYIVSITIHPDYRMQGIGRKLIDSLIQKFSVRRREIQLICEETNENLLFFKTLGFKSVLVRNHYEKCDGILWVFC